MSVACAMILWMSITMTSTDNTEDDTALCFSHRAAGDPDYRAYHDDEWGRAVHGETELFERVCLEIFEVGLSWHAILHRRDAFRDRFHGFDPAMVAAFSDADTEHLAADAAIIRNRAKIKACVTAAKTLLAMHDQGETLDGLIWGFMPANHPRPTIATRPALTPESEALAKALRAKGFTFVGPTNIYATMQACGLVNDHIVGCAIGDTIDRQGG